MGRDRGMDLMGDRDTVGAMHSGWILWCMRGLLAECIAPTGFWLWMGDRGFDLMGDRKWGEIA